MGSDPVAVSNFLADEFQSGKQYRTLNVYRSALSSTLPPAGNLPLGQSLMVRRLLTGAYNSRPPQPRYQSTWPVSTVLDHIVSLGPNEGLSLDKLSGKLVMLFALAKAPRVSELCALSLQTCSRQRGGVSFVLTELTKTQRPGSNMCTFYVPCLDKEPLVCPVQCLEVYVEKTAALRGTRKLFIATRRPHTAVTSATLARWIKNMLLAAGVADEFSAHSTRGASTTWALHRGATLADVLAAANWSGSHTFIQHYYRPSSHGAFGKAVLTSST